MARKNENNYFNMFIQSAGYASKAAKMLADIYRNFKPENLPAQLEAAHAIEHEGDTLRHDLMNRLMKEFITPIEREDIIHLSEAIDEVTDAIEDVVMRTYMYNVSTIRPEALEITEIIVSCCDALENMLKEFENFRKSTGIKDKVIMVNEKESIGDHIYKKAVRNLFTDPTVTPMEAIAWNELFHRLEQCCDDCEEVANVVESIIMKNS